MWADLRMCLNVIFIWKPFYYDYFCHKIDSEKLRFRFKIKSGEILSIT